MAYLVETSALAYRCKRTTLNFSFCVPRSAVRSISGRVVIWTFYLEEAQSAMAWGLVITTPSMIW